MSQFLELSNFDVKLKDLGYNNKHTIVLYMGGNPIEIILYSSDLVKLRDFLVENVK